MGHQSSPIRASSGRARLPAVGRKQNHPTTRRYVGEKPPTHPKVPVPPTQLVPEEMPRTLAEVNNLRHTTPSALTE